MNRPSEEQEAEPGDADAAGKVAAEDSTGSKPDPVRRVTLIVFAVIGRRRALSASPSGKKCVVPWLRTTTMTPGASVCMR